MGLPAETTCRLSSWHHLWPSRSSSCRHLSSCLPSCRPTFRRSSSAEPSACHPTFSCRQTFAHRPPACSSSRNPMIPNTRPPAWHNQNRVRHTSEISQESLSKEVTAQRLRRSQDRKPKQPTHENRHSGNTAGSAGRSRKFRVGQSLSPAHSCLSQHSFDASTSERLTIIPGTLTRRSSLHSSQPAAFHFRHPALPHRSKALQQRLILIRTARTLFQMCGNRFK